MAELVLKCQFCDWRPGEDQQMMVVEAHYQLKHPEHLGDLKLEMVCICFKCDIVAPLERKLALRSGRAKYIHRCTQCLRSYTVEANG